MNTPEYLIDRPAEPGAITRAWLPWALGRIDNIATLGGSITPATDTAATVARALLHLISALHTVAPAVAPQPIPAGDGGIHIAWREHGFELDLEIEPDGRIGGWLHRIADKAEVTWGEEPDTVTPGLEPAPTPETVAAVLAIVDAPYRPGLDVQFDDAEPS